MPIMSYSIEKETSWLHRLMDMVFVCLFVLNIPPTAKVIWGKPWLNSKPISHDFCHLPLICLFLGGLYWKQYGSRSDCSFCSSLIRVHIVSFEETIA